MYKVLLLILITFLFNACSSNDLIKKSNPKVIARKNFEQKLGKYYGAAHARNIIRYDLLGIEGDKNIISELYTNAYSPAISLKTYKTQLVNAELKHINLTEKQKIDNAFAKLTLIANVYNLSFAKLNIKSTKARPKLKPLNNLLVYCNNLNKKFGSVPIYNPMQKFSITSPYGPRFNRFNKRFGFHHGIDLIAPKDYIYASTIGKVTFAGKMNGYGNVVKISHGNNIHTLYAHLAKIYVSKHSIVGAGQIIALMGNTGNSTGKHLHYEIRTNNKSINPSPFLNKNFF